MKKVLFYLLSFTWGLPTTLMGLIGALILRLTGHKAKKWGYCWYFAYGKDRWGGMSLGVFFFCDRGESAHIRCHEHGHALQNCLYGPLMLFLVDAPSFLRYHWREFCAKKRHRLPKNDYDAVWFERQATAWGTKFCQELDEQAENGTDRA